MTGISEMFAELSGADAYDMQATFEWYARERLAVRREASRLWYKTHRQHAKEYAAKWRAEHREHVREYHRKWRAANRTAKPARPAETLEQRRARQREASRRHYAKKLAAAGKPAPGTRDGRGRPRIES